MKASKVLFSQKKRTRPARALIISFFLFALLTGCAPNAREPDALALARVLVVQGDGPVTVTAVCQAEEDGEPLRGQASGRDFAEARQALPWTGERELALTNLSYLIIETGADVAAVAETVLADRELSPGAAVWLTQDAAALLEGCADPAGRLAVLEEQGVHAPTAAQALASIKTDGRVRAPLLVWDDGLLKAAGAVEWEAET